MENSPKIQTRAAKRNASEALLKYSWNSKERDSDLALFNFFGFYSEAQINEMLNKTQEEAIDEPFENFDENHRWSKRIKKLKEQSTHDIRIAPSGIHGIGVFTHSNIGKTVIIMIYTGEIITKEECDKREKRYMAQGRNESFFATLDGCHVLDATFSTSISKYINHSCNPNTILEVIQVEGVKTIVITSLRRIQSGEELTIDYGYIDEEQRVHCRCNSPNCRGFVNYI